MQNLRNCSARAARNDRAVAHLGRPGTSASGRVYVRAVTVLGWSDAAGAYTQAFGSEDLDASNLMLAITGFCPAMTRA